MVGLSDATTAFHNILWSDAELVGIAIDYSDVVVTLRESTGLLRRVICEGYVGYRTAGFWDEIVIAKAELEPQGEFLESCLLSLTKRLGADRASSGSDARNRSMALQLTVTLLDDCELLVAMKGLRTEVVSEI
jgi:hypothetical protein